MKKQHAFVALLLLCFVPSVMIFAQSGANSVKADSAKTKGIHPYSDEENTKNIVSQEHANWSIFLHGGFNVLAGDFNKDQGKELKSNLAFPSVGLGVDCKFNPTWGLGVDYTFRQVGAKGNTSIKDDAGNAINMSNLLQGYQHEAAVFLMFDIMNAFAPKSVHKIVALNLIAGGNFLAYKNTNQTPVSMKLKSSEGVPFYRYDHWKNKTGTEAYQQAYPDGSEARKMDKYAFTGGFIGGASLEFNLCREIALGLRALYHYYGTDKLDGRPNVGTNNDGMFDTELLLRWKLQSQKKSHVDNYINEAELAKLSGKAVTPKDTVVVYHRDTVAIYGAPSSSSVAATGDTTTNIYNTTIISNPESEKANYYYVYFDMDHYNLSDNALVVIQQVADRMKDDPSLRAVIIGYCDNVGSVAYNKRLGQNRSQNVLEELLYEHGIAGDHMFAIGKGIVVGKRSSSQYAPNRRVEIRLVNETFYGNLRAQYREDIEAQETFIKTREAKK